MAPRSPEAPRTRRRWLRRLGLALVLGLGLFGAWAATVDLPPGALEPSRLASVKFFDRQGRPLREVLSREDGRSTWVPLAQISPHLVQATLAGEDRRFYRHHGVDALALARAVVQAARSGRVVSGASTVTMQLARLLAGLPRTFGAKLRQMALAWQLEARLSKEQLLWHYLNRAPYGNGTFGAEAAARRYFGKPAAGLSLAEAALLSALPRGPSRYDPYKNRARLLRRQRYILGLMRQQGRITAQQHRLAVAQPIDWEAAARPFRAPHLTRHLLSDPRLAGASRVQTTVDLQLQTKVEAAVARTIRAMADRGVQNAAVLVVDNASGEVLAYVGSADFFSAEHDGQVDGTLALRQPGSAIKPFTYALGLERGKTPASLLRDLPGHFTTEQGDYAPRNYDDTFHGPVRLRVALASSYNVPAVRLAHYVGVERLLDRLRELGFASLTRSARHYGLGLTLGNGEVTLHELAAAYATLARGGLSLAPAATPPKKTPKQTAPRPSPLRLLRRARTPTGETLDLGPAPQPGSGRRIFDRRVAYLVSHILSDPLARMPAFGRNTPLSLEFPAAVKTGTSKDFRDNWTVGYTPAVTVAVWVGNFDGSSMHNVSGVSGAGPLWAEVMRLAMEEREAEAFGRPAGLHTRRICPLSGELAGPHCPAAVDELFVAGSAPTRRCTFHREVALDRRNGLLAGPGCPEAELQRRPMTLFPPAYRAWARAQGMAAPPERFSPLCPGDPGPAAVRVVAPRPGDHYYVDPDLRRSYQRIPLEAEVRGSPAALEWRVDGQVVSRARFPYAASWPITRGRHRVEAVLPDGTRSEAVTITVE